MLPSVHMLRIARLTLRWSQRHLAERAGVAQPVVARMENLKSNPTAKTMATLAKALEEGGIDFLPASDRHWETIALRKDFPRETLEGPPTSSAGKPESKE